MEDLYKHIESLGKEHGYKNMTVLCKAAEWRELWKICTSI